MYFTLHRHPALLAVVKLPPAPKPTMPDQGFYCLLQTPGELTLICEEGKAPPQAQEVNAGWVGFEVQGTLDFSLTGILATLTGSLAEAEISLFALSTFNTDWILVKQEMAARAAEAWRARGHAVE